MCMVCESVSEERRHGEGAGVYGTRLCRLDHIFFTCVFSLFFFFCVKVQKSGGQGKKCHSRTMMSRIADRALK
jgi:hypothetical protein